MDRANFHQSLPLGETSGLTPGRLAADNDRPDLKALYDAHRWFELRESVVKGTAPVFYQAAVACAFNDLPRCERKLAHLIKSAARTDDAIEAHRLLAASYFRQGKYREALAHVDALVALRPQDSDIRDDRPVLAALHNFGDQEWYEELPAACNYRTPDCRS